MQVGDVGFADYVAEDRQNLIWVQKPFVFAQLVLIIKLLNLFGNELSARHYNLHLIDRGSSVGQFFQPAYAFLVGLKFHLFELNLLRMGLRSYSISQTLFIKTKPILYCKVFRFVVFHQSQGFTQFIVSVFSLHASNRETLLIEGGIFKKNSSNNAQNVFIIGDQVIL